MAIWCSVKWTQEFLGPYSWQPFRKEIWNSCSAAACRSCWICFFAIPSKTTYTSTTWPPSKTMCTLALFTRLQIAQIFIMCRVQRLHFPEPVNHKNLEVDWLACEFRQLLGRVKPIISQRPQSFHCIFPTATDATLQVFTRPAGAEVEIFVRELGDFSECRGHSQVTSWTLLNNCSNRSSMVCLEDGTVNGKHAVPVWRVFHVFSKFVEASFKKPSARSFVSYDNSVTHEPVLLQQEPTRN